MPDRIAHAAVVLMTLCVVALTANHFTRQPRSRPSVVPVEPLSETDWTAFVANGRSTGPDSAPLVLLEFGDFECPACRSAAPRVRRLLEQFPTELRFVYRHWPLSYHRHAYPAARAAECAGEQGMFWKMHDILYDKQDSLGVIPFRDFGKRIGIPQPVRFESCVSQNDSVARISVDVVDALRAKGGGTPALFLNRNPVRTSHLDSAYVAKMLDQFRPKTSGK